MRGTGFEGLIAGPFATMSLVDWWPLRVALAAVTVLVAILLVWWMRRPIARIGLLSLVVVLVAANALVAVNAYFGYYLTIGQALGLDGENQGSLAMLNAQKTRPASGLVVSIDIPGSSSGFQARPARVYLPPAWFDHPRPKLPVIVLLHGTPGTPQDWIDGGRAKVTADRWALGHGGVAPIVVMPDVNGSAFADTECVDSDLGQVETYLSADVPKFVRSRFVTLDPGQDWAVGGLSEGGTCSIMLALRHPTVYATFADFGGLAGPRTGDGNDPGDTADSLFDGSHAEFDAHEPAQLLAHGRYPGLHGFFAVGDNDPEPLAAANLLQDLSRKAGIDTEKVVIPGGQHTFDVWSTAFSDALPWLVQRFGSNNPHPQEPAKDPRAQVRPGPTRHTPPRARPVRVNHGWPGSRTR